jgi:uncharacterized protein (UPF0332 family)
LAYHDELLQHAEELVHKRSNNPTQVDLRRSVSSAYYAVFHLFVQLQEQRHEADYNIKDDWT